MNDDHYHKNCNCTVDRSHVIYHYLFETFRLERIDGSPLIGDTSLINFFKALFGFLGWSSRLSYDDSEARIEDSPSESGGGISGNTESTLMDDWKRKIIILLSYPFINETLCANIIFTIPTVAFLKLGLLVLGRGGRRSSPMELGTSAWQLDPQRVDARMDLTVLFFFSLRSLGGGPQASHWVDSDFDEERRPLPLSVLSIVAWTLQYRSINFYLCKHDIVMMH